MIHQLRICLHASPAVVTRVPGYCVIVWIRTPGSPSCRLLTVPGAVPESRTPRQNGALLPGCVRARTAFESVGCGSATEAAGAAAAGTGSLIGASAGALVCAMAALQSTAASAAPSKPRRIRLCMATPGY
jgi:hypothetical protein